MIGLVVSENMPDNILFYLYSRYSNVAISWVCLNQQFKIIHQSTTIQKLKNLEGGRCLHAAGVYTYPPICVIYSNVAMYCVCLNEQFKIIHQSTTAQKLKNIEGGRCLPTAGVYTYPPICVIYSCVAMSCVCLNEQFKIIHQSTTIQKLKKLTRRQVSAYCRCIHLSTYMCYIQ